MLEKAGFSVRWSKRMNKTVREPEIENIGLL